MAYRRPTMITRYMFEKIRKLINEGKNNSEIARELKVNRKTVAKYRKSNTPPHYSERAVITKADPFESFSDRVDELLKIDGITGAEIFAVIADEGYKGSERTVQRRLSVKRKLLSKERFFEQEYTPGEQCQFDFKERVMLPFVDGQREVHLHFGTMPYSDTFYITGYPYKNYEAFMNGCHSFFEYIEGMPENIRIDNLSPCVTKVLKGNKRKYTQSFEKSIEYYGYGVLPCAPAKGSDKGDVERDIRTHANRLKNLIRIYGTVFYDWDDLNQYLHNYCVKTAKEPSKEKLEEEKKNLKVLPVKDDSIINHTLEVRCNSYGMIRIDRCKASYSVPDNMIGEKCYAVLTPFNVIVYSDPARKNQIALHPRNPIGEHSVKVEHVINSLHRKPGALLRWKHKETIIGAHPSFRMYYKYLKNLNLDNLDQIFLRTINLIQNCQVSELAIAIELIMSESSTAPFDDIKALILPENSTSKLTNLNQEKLVPKLEIYDQLIPNLKDVS